MSAITTVKLMKVSHHYRPFITQEMVMAKKGCEKCFGRGHRGFNRNDGKPVPCTCLVIDYDKLLAAVAAAQVKDADKLKPVMLTAQEKDIAHAPA